MSVRTYAATALLASGSWLAIGTAAPAFALCDAYSGACPSAPPNNGGGGTDIGGGTDSRAVGTESPAPGTDSPTTGTDEAPAQPNTGADAGAGSAPGNEVGSTDAEIGTTAVSPSTLPFTGGELVLMTAVGLGALAGGTALVVAGRRKAATAA